MAHNEDFHNDTGFLLQVRTQIQNHFSHVLAAALRIGTDVLEINSKGHILWNRDHKLSLDGLPFSFGGGSTEEYRLKYPFPARNSLAKNATHVDMKLFAGGKVYRLRLGKHGGYLDFKTNGHFMGVWIHGRKAEFMGSVGLLGQGGTGERMSRSGTKMKSTLEHVFEWQVKSHEECLFAEPPTSLKICRILPIKLSKDTYTANAG